MASRREGGRRRFEFATSPKLSPHLFTLTSGPFDTTSTAADGVPIHLHTPSGLPADRALAETAADVVRFCNRHLSVPYPWPKLDLVVVPELDGAAIETTSVVHFRQSSVVLRPEDGAERRRDVAELTAHEIAHQWFGSLVTPASWEHLWLSEGFATWLASKFMTGRDGQSAEIARAKRMRAAMSADSLRTSRPLTAASTGVADLPELYDSITYQKGAALLEMLEEWLGEEVFTRGVTRYLQERAHGHATTADLWSALEVVSGEPVAAVAAPFAGRAGVPLLHFEWTNDTVRVTQAADDVRAIPVRVKAGLAGGAIERRTILLTTRSEEMRFPAPVDWLLGNADAKGYYRSAYAAFRASAALSGAELITLFSDAWDAMWSGELDPVEYLRLVEEVGGSEPQRSLVREQAAELGDVLAGDGRRQQFDAWARDVLAVEGRPPSDVRKRWQELKAEWTTRSNDAASFDDRRRITALAALSDRQSRDEIAKFFASGTPAGLRRTVTLTLEKIDARIAFREREQPAFDAWLTRAASGGFPAGDEITRAHSLLTALAGGFRGALAQQSWLRGLRCPVPAWMQPAAELEAVVAALERRIIGVFAGRTMIGTDVVEAAGRLREDLLAAAAWGEHALGHLPQTSSREPMNVIASLLARRRATSDVVFRRAITFAAVFRLDQAAQHLRELLRGSAATGRVARSLVQRVAEGEESAALRSALAKEAAPDPAALRSQAAALATLAVTNGRDAHDSDEGSATAAKRSRPTGSDS
jgi:hypothetical protein